MDKKPVEKFAYWCGQAAAMVVAASIGILVIGVAVSLVFKILSFLF